MKLIKLPFLILFLSLTIQAEAPPEPEEDHSSSTGARATAPTVDIQEELRKEFAYDTAALLEELSKPSAITTPKLIKEALAKYGKVEEKLSYKLNDLLKEAQHLTSAQKYEIAISVFNERKVLLESVSKQLETELNKLSTDRKFSIFATVGRIIKLNAAVLAEGYKTEANRLQKNLKQKIAFTDPGCPSCQVGYQPLSKLLEDAGLAERVPKHTQGYGNTVRLNKGKKLAVLRFSPITGAPRVKLEPTAANLKEDTRGANFVDLNYKDKDHKEIIDNKYFYYKKFAHLYTGDTKERLNEFFRWYETTASKADQTEARAIYAKDSTVPKTPAKQFNPHAKGHVVIGNHCPSCEPWKAVLRKVLGLGIGAHIPGGVYDIQIGNANYSILVDGPSPSGRIPFPAGSRPPSGDAKKR